MVTILKCKMCGGDIKLSEDKTLGICDSCGSTSTFPKVADEKRVAAFNRGNFYRRTGEFDKALSIYEQIILEDDTDAEAHWCAAISRFGIEYVEDPVSMEYFPTCHRVSFDSFLDDIDVKAALQYSEGNTNRQYQKEANKISDVQKGILATSINEEPFDIFICYKETDDLGRRTQDSVLAQDIYYRLVDEGFKVFFSRITLEDKVGSEYEPYIFAALNSAKVMIVIGTKKEYLESVWVKNEWSRFISLMKKDRSRVVLPCYKDMNPYDMPSTLSVLQSYDMTAIGFAQDLVYGIKKIISRQDNSQKKAVGKSSDSTTENIDAIVKNGFLALEEHAWDKANSYFDKATNINPQMAEIYLGKVLVEEKCGTIDDFAKKKLGLLKSARPEQITVDFISSDELNKIINEKAVLNYLSVDEIKSIFSKEYYINSYVYAYRNALKNLKESFQHNTNIARAFRFANGSTKNNLERLKSYLITQYEKTIQDAVEADKKNTEDIQTKYAGMKEAAYRKVDDEYNRALEKREDDYKEALSAISGIKTPDDALRIRDRFLRIGDYKDCVSMARTFEERALELTEKEKKKKRKILIISCSSVVATAAIALLMIYVIIPKIKYSNAMKEIENGNYEYAYEILSSLGNEEAIVKNKYERAGALFDKQEYDEAKRLYNEILEYKDAKDKAIECDIALGDLLTSQGNYEEAIAVYNRDEEHKEKSDECRMKWAESLIKEEQYEAAYAIMEEMGNNDAIISSKYDRALVLIDSGDYAAAYILLEGLDYKDSVSKQKMIEESDEWIKVCPVGGTVLFGSYEQDNNSENGKEEIEWIVLAREGDRSLLISKYALDCQPYNTSNTDVTWETCTLRKWLHESFLNSAFSEEDLALIPEVTVNADKNQKYNTNPGNNTTDQVFLLSITEANKYFSIKHDYLKCSPTEYAVAQRAWVNDKIKVDGRAACRWRLRTPGKSSNFAAFVDFNGNIKNDGNNVNLLVIGVRPALWVDIGS